MTKARQKGVRKVNEMKIKARETIGGATWAARSLHFWAYSLKDSCSFLHMFYSYILSEAISEFYRYYQKKAIIKSFQEWTREGSRLVYKVTTALVRLSWKKCVNNVSSFAYTPIFWHYIFRWFLGQVVPLYLSKFGTLNFGRLMTSGTRHNSAMSAKA